MSQFNSDGTEKDSKYVRCVTMQSFVSMEFIFNFKSLLV